MLKKLYYNDRQKSEKLIYGDDKMIVENMLNMQLMMFLLVATGFLARKKGIVGTEGRLNMIDLCLYVTLPFNVLNSFLGEWDRDMLLSCSLILLLSAGYNVVSIIFGAILYRRTDFKKQKPLRYGTIVSNGGFLGNPIIEGIYGSSGLVYAALFMLPVRIVMWSYGVSVFLKGEAGASNNKKGLLKKVVTHPCIVAIYIGIAIMVSGITLPTFLENTISSLSKCNTPLSMMLVGMLLAEINPKGLIDKTMVFYTSVRLLIIPMVIFILTAFLPIDPILRAITVIMAGMPAPITTALMSAKYGGDEKYAAGMIFTTTILSLVTLPIWCAFL